MCSLHPRVVKRAYEELEEIRSRLKTEVTDADFLALKAAKQRAVDELQLLSECASQERYLKVLQSPHPLKKVQEVQKHLDDLLKDLHR